MRLHHYLSSAFLLIFMCAIAKTTSSIAKASSSAPLSHKASEGFRKATADKIANKQKKYVILFDLMNVIIKENYVGFAKKIGYGNLASYTLTHWKNPGYRCLDMLEAMSKHESQKPHIIITLKKRIMPRCLVELQEGKKTCCQVKNEIMKCIEHLDAQKHFSSTKEKALMSAIMDLILDPETTTSMIEPIKSTMQLAQKLKAAGHTIYLFANAPTELYTTVQKKYPDIINMFDGVVVSSEVKAVKPDHAIFNHLLTTHNLAAQDCILIDDLEESVASAKQLGMRAFVYDKNVISKLKKSGVKF